jgi:hypothetical protein
MFGFDSLLRHSSAPVARAFGDRITFDRNIMKYFNHTKIRDGDLVTVERSNGKIPAVVIKVLRPHTKDALDWNSPDGGVLIEGGGLGLFVANHLEKDPEIEFVRRTP